MDGPIHGEHDQHLAGGEDVPAACYKILVHEEGGQPKVLAFIIPETVTANARPAEFTVSVREIEAQTRLDFMAELPDEEEERVEAGKAGVW